MKPSIVRPSPVKATILNGALDGDNHVDAVAAALTDRWESAGWEVSTWQLRDEKIAYCLGCFECWTKTPGICRIDDAGRSVAASVIQSDLLVYVTPITFGGYSSELKKAVDRSICLIMPFFQRIGGEVHHHARYARYPALLGVGILAEPDPQQEQIFGQLIERNAINMHAPTHGSFVVYRNEAPERGLSELAATEDSLVESERVFA